ncbi:hypothetical protein GOP47_0012588 [Adiantum capillus-veneris]|uniref:PsbP C-terminal domain-containing protein n=1 Tax=Adiantum capillus-veneris TaxID=13818 RepID=A0A9D4URG8_ADICA|nr:hypothetical protein GOP47_0012588 [Adiantum capillus-veneris]
MAVCNLLGSNFVVPASPNLDNATRANSSRSTHISVSAGKAVHSIRASSHGSSGETEGRQGDIAAAADVPLAVASLSRRALLGLSTSTAVALGGNLAGITSFLLSLNTGLSRSLKLDVVYPINGYKRCLEKNFEFIYPDRWVGDQRLLYRAVEKAEKQRLYGEAGVANIRTSSLVEPVVAFGPPGSSGELNVSVIVAPVPQDFRLDKLGDPKTAGDVILKSFTSNSKVIPTLLHAEKREDLLNGGRFLYYNLEFSVQGQSFLRHNVSVYAAYNGQLFSMNAQTPEKLWPDFKQQFFEMANSFKVRL